MPVMDSPEYAGKNQGELLRVAKEKEHVWTTFSPSYTLGVRLLGFIICTLRTLYNICN